MALESLKNVTEINGEKISYVQNISEYLNTAEKINGIVHDDANCLFFKIQQGPIREAGKNGVQVEDVIAVALHIVTELNNNFPCEENDMMISHLGYAVMWSKNRTANREARNVEGTNNG